MRGALAPYLLDYLRYFVLFEDDGRWSRRSPATTSSTRCAAIEQVVAASRRQAASLRGKGGVVWHAGQRQEHHHDLLCARVMQEPAMENPTIVVITDRNDLDGQLFGVFSLAKTCCANSPVQADTRQELRQLLANRPSGGIVFATIQKFMPGEDEDCSRCCRTAATSW